jgi:hypothetical protein
VTHRVLQVHLAPIGHPVRVLLQEGSGADAGTPARDEFLRQSLASAGTEPQFFNRWAKTSEKLAPSTTVCIRVPSSCSMFFVQLCSTYPRGFNRYEQELALGPRDFEFIHVLGQGAFAKVGFKCWHTKIPVLRWCLFQVYLVRGKGANNQKWYAMKAYNKKSIVKKKQVCAHGSLTHMSLNLTL